ncbi:TPA: hypothetical protein M4488_001596 [Salmonella enterica]|nr:hypothetical protein [Salmonella enterica subsp. enterica serovar Derby]HCC3272102.1 hypothetical protein [Salmonella enterica]MDR5179069.1 hypothetical protein [Salmonella enterica subsp. enterica serovar Derby]MDR5274508.1 hypothetical protein [Salmonella enterica subsp. enterica serovar Derby]HCC3276091.1 hypothetical protein [Salmonella enterica]
MNEEMKLLFDNWTTEQDQKVIGKKSVDFYIKHSDNDNVLSFYGSVLSGMDIDAFSYTLRYHIEQCRKYNITLSREDKTEITLSVLNKLKCHKGIAFDEYRNKLIHIISGMDYWEAINSESNKYTLWVVPQDLRLHLFFLDEIYRL